MKCQRQLVYARQIVVIEVASPVMRLVFEKYSQKEVSVHDDTSDIRCGYSPLESLIYSILANFKNRHFGF